MKIIKVIKRNTKECIVSHVEIADSFLTRMRGLLGRKGLLKDQGLLITHCNSIHMMFMRFPIDVIFLNKDNVVVGLCHNIKPYRLSSIYLKASKALEISAGVALEKKLIVGDRLDFV